MDASFNGMSSFPRLINCFPSLKRLLHNTHNLALAGAGVSQERLTKDTAKKSSTPMRAVQRDATRAKTVPDAPDIACTSFDKGVDAHAGDLIGLDRAGMGPVGVAGDQLRAIVERIEIVVRTAALQTRRSWS